MHIHQAERHMNVLTSLPQACFLWFQNPHTAQSILADPLLLNGGSQEVWDSRLVCGKPRIGAQARSFHSLYCILRGQEPEIAGSHSQDLCCHSQMGSPFWPSDGGGRCRTLVTPHMRTANPPICCYLILQRRAHLSQCYVTSSFSLLSVLALCLAFPLGYIFLAGLLPKWSGYFSDNWKGYANQRISLWNTALETLDQTHHRSFSDPNLN